MVTLFGKMLVRVSQDRRSESSKEGLLKCSLGRFRIRSFQLEDLLTGDYEGYFTVMKIDPYCHQHQGKFLVELEAVIEKMAFTSQPMDMTEKTSGMQRSLLSELESLTDENPQIEVTERKSFYLEEQSESFTLEEEDDNEDARLFGELYPLPSKVRLDASQERSILRQQVSRLREMGYQFDEKAQQWVS